MNAVVVNAEPVQAAPAIAPIRVAVYTADQNPHRDRSLGITSMTGSLLDAMQQRDDVKVTLVTSRSSYGNAGRIETRSRLPFRTDGTLGRLVCDTFHPWFSHPPCDLWYYPKGYLSLLTRPHRPMVGTMHDTILQFHADHYPETRSASAFRYWIYVMKNSLRRLDCVMTVSEHAKQQLLEFCVRYQIKPPRIAVTYESSSWESMRFDRKAKRDHVVHLASAAPHKKTNRLLQMWQELQNAGKALPILQLIGSLDAQGRQLVDQLKHVQVSRPLAEREFAETIGEARALILSSEIEGFGLPALEAYYVGTPVCYVSGTSVDEVVTEAGRFGAFELQDITSFSAALDRALSAAANRLIVFHRRSINFIRINSMPREWCKRLVKCCKDQVASSSSDCQRTGW